MKLLEENIGGGLLDIGLSNDFFFKSQSIKEKINKRDCDLE